MALYSGGFHKGRVFVGPLVDRDHFIPVISFDNPDAARRVIAEKNLPYAEAAFKEFLEVASGCGMDVRDVVEIMLRKYGFRR
jgi:hypothetical protein